MEKFSYNSYPDSAESSPRSREVDFENPPPWEDQQQTQSSYKVKFMCSYGGKIQPRPHDNQLTYVNGDTKIMSVDRSIRFQSLVSKLTTVCGGGSAGGDGGGGGEISFKYQLPGEDLDALISVTNDDDLEHMMHEYDRLLRMSTKPARMRLFLFSSSPISGGFGSEGSIKSNPIPTRPESEKSVTAAPSSNADFLFGSEKLTPQSPPAVTVRQQIQNPPVSFEPPVFVSQPVIQQPDQAEIQRQIHEFQMIQIRDQEQQQMQQQQHQLQQQQQQQEAMYRRKSEDFSPTYSPAISQTNQQPPIGYWQGNNNNNNIPGNVYTTMPTNLPEQQQQQQQVYMIQPQSQAPPQGPLYHSLMRPPPPTQGNQGYYPSPVQTYMEQQPQNQQGYNVVQPQPQYSVGPQVMTSGGPMGLQETAPFQQMGNPVYYTVAGEGMMVQPQPQPQPQQSQPQYQGMGQPVSGMTDTRTGPDGKVTVNMAPKASD